MSEIADLSPEKRCQILDGAAEIFAEDGYEGASMSRIAARAGVSKGTLYNYFDGKSQLFADWVGRECGRTLQDSFALGDVADDARAGLGEIGRRMLRAMLSPVGLVIYRMAVAEVLKFPEVPRVFYASGPARAKAAMGDWLRARVATGQFAIPDLEAATDQFFALCQAGVAMRRRLGLQADVTDEEVAAVIEGAVTLFLNTYGVRP